MGIFFQLCAFAALGQPPAPQPPAPQPIPPQPTISSQPTLTITLQDALARARQFAPALESAKLASEIAREDVKQARAARLPTVNGFNQFIYTQGNGTPSGVFVANDGVHVYNEQLQLHEEVLAIGRSGEILRTQAAFATARAKTEVAARGLNATVVGSYYGLVSAQRKLANAQTSLREAEQFLDITQKQERGGEAAHADVIKAQLTVEQRQRDVLDAGAAIDKAKMALAVLIFPTFRDDFTVVDDLSSEAMTLEGRAAVEQQAISNSPDVLAAQANLRETALGITVAKYAYLPSLSIDFFYGIDANQLAFRTHYATQATGRSTLPNYLVPYRQNLGYVGQATLNIPILTWGVTRSKIRQAELRQQQAQLDLSQTERQLHANIEGYYREAEVARDQLESLRRSQDLATESLRLTLLRYQAGEATALEVVDAQNTVTQARAGYDDGLVRYRTALASLQTLTGVF